MVNCCIASKLGEEIINLELSDGNVSKKSNYGYLMPWNEYYSVKVLNTVLQKGLRAKVSMKNFKNGNKFYDYGTIFIPVQNQILTNAASLLAKRRENIAVKEAKKQNFDEIVASLKSRLTSFDFKMSYEYVALCSLVIVVAGLLQAPTYKGDVVAFQIETQVVLAEEIDEDFEEMEFIEGEIVR